jgi:hypothetical protein
MDQIVRESSQAPFPADSQPTRWDSPKVHDVPTLSLPAVGVGNETNPAEVEGRKLAQAARRRAEHELQTRLRGVYLAQIERTQEDAFSRAQPDIERKLKAAQERRLAAFQAYADQRGALMTRLVLLTGFPDPDPDSRQPVPSGAGPAGRRKLADDIRSQIRALDAKYDASVRQLFAEAEASRDQALTDIQAQFVKARDQAETDAEAEAKTEMAKVGNELKEALAGRHIAAMAAVTGRKVQPPTLPPAVDTPLTTPGPSSSALFQQARDQVSIWMALKGYRQVTSPRDGRDGTDEFLKWRNSHHLGPLAN